MDSLSAGGSWQSLVEMMPNPFSSAATNKTSLPSNVSAVEVETLLKQVGKCDKTRVDYVHVYSDKSWHSIELQLAELIGRKDYVTAAACLCQWPDDRKGKNWFDLLIKCIFQCPGSPLLSQVISGLSEHVETTEAPAKAYLEVLNQLQECNGVTSPSGFQQFMDWLMRWRLSDCQPRLDLLEKVPFEMRQMRPDLPVIDYAGVLMPEDMGWGGVHAGDFPCLSIYLKHTQWLQHFITCSFLKQADLPVVKSVAKHWLTDEDCNDIRNQLFKNNLHPLSVLGMEPRPWNLMLTVLEREVTDRDTELSREISRCDGNGVTATAITPEQLTAFRAPGQPFIFGRTIAAIDPENKTENVYLKIQSGKEKDQDFLREAERLKFFYENRDRLNLSEPVLKVDAVLKTDSLNTVLSECNLSDVDKSQLLWRCAHDNFYRQFWKALENDWSDDCNKAQRWAEQTHWHQMLEEDSLLPPEKKQKLMKHLLKSDGAAHLLLLKCPPGYRNDQYIYQSNDRGEVTRALASYALEYGGMWAKKVMGPDACSAFHGTSSNRKYGFLASSAMNNNIGGIDQWSGTSTDYPNIGLHGMRDRGDVKTVSECDITEMCDGYTNYDAEELEGARALQHRGQFESIARAAWGMVLLYGRSLKSRFDPDKHEHVQRIKDDLERFLGALFSKAFEISLPECVSLMNQQGHLDQVAREMSYFMTNAYVKDIRKGIIPESVYPDYKGVRHGHRLVSYLAETLSDEGFQGDCPSVHLGSGNGRNPLMALDALVVKMLAYGTLGCIAKEAKR